jgi:hypothetical protein
MDHSTFSTATREEVQNHLALHHALYLLFNVSHYLRQYLSEREPLMQSQWMMNAWTLAIEDYLESTQRTVGKS